MVCLEVAGGGASIENNTDEVEEMCAENRGCIISYLQNVKVLKKCNKQ